MIVSSEDFKLSGALNWPAAPYDFQSAFLSGQGALRNHKGTLHDIEDGGPLLSFFSLKAMRRRLALDFDDVFDDGLAFDSMSSSFYIEKGVLRSDDFKMKALVGDMYLRGRLDLGRGEVYSKIKFMPDLTSNLPILSAFAMNPVSALYVFAATTLFSPVIDAITELNYEITGPLDHLQVKEISRKQSKVEVPYRQKSKR